jgi:histidine triad (HIT) family protein
MSRPACVFCDIIAGTAPCTLFADDADSIAIVPKDPVVPGHVIVLPREHVADATGDPVLTGAVMELAASIAQEYDAANIITSIGAAATQSIMHLHLHVVPRRPGDGLALPWTGQVRGDRDE